MICLPKEVTDKFKKALKDGELKVPDLIKMSTEELNASFGDILGKEYAKPVTLMWEKKMILENKQEGIIDFIKTVGGLKPEVRNDLVAKVLKNEKAFTPDEFNNLKNEVIDNILDVQPTEAEVKNIIELSKKIEEAKTYNGIKDTEGLLDAFEKLDQSTLSPEQQKAIKDLRTKLNAEKSARQAELDRIKTEREELAKKQKAEREAVKAKRAEERANIRAKNLQERELAKEMARIEREQLKEEQAFDKEQERDEERLVRAEERANMMKERQDLKAATGESLRKLSKILLKPKGERFKGIEQFSPELQAQIKDVVEKRNDMLNGDNRMIYGRAKVALENYVSSLTGKTIAEEFKDAPIKTTAGTIKALKATFDDSVLGRQGYKTMLTNPTVWAKNGLLTFKDIWDTFDGKAVMDEIRADIVSRENYANYKKMKLAVNVREEQHPTSIIEKVPYVGKFAQASENAFAGFMLRTRADLADIYIKAAQNNGKDITEDKSEAEDWGKLINSQTARGDLGPAEGLADFFNLTFFSIRKLVADFDTLTAHGLGFRFKNKSARKQAAINLLKIIGGLSIMLLTAKALLGKDAVELDPRSADFGKIKEGNTRFDITGGMGSLITLAARVSPVFWGGTPKSKSSVTGDIKDLNQGGFGSISVGDMLGDFLSNKESPIGALFHHIIQQKDQNGNPVSLGGELGNLVSPLPISNASNLLQDPKSANFVLGVIADGLGFGTNTYGASAKQDHTKEIADLLKQNYENKAEGKAQLSVNQIAKEVYGDGADDIQKNAIAKEKEFYRVFGFDNKTANDLNDAKTANDMIKILDESKKNMTEDEFRKFYNKTRTSVVLPSGGTSQVLVTNALDKRWNEYQKTGTLTDDGAIEQGNTERNLLDIIGTTAKALGTDPLETMKLILQNQSIRRIDNGQIIINRNTNFLDTKVGQNGYSAGVKKDRDAGKDQRLDHTIPVELGGLEKGGDAINLLLLSEAEWKRNSPVENYLGKKLREGSINGSKARELIIRYKAGRGQAISPDYMNEYQKEYGGLPLSFDDIKQQLDK